MLREFLISNRSEIIALSEEKSRILAGVLLSSEQLKVGLPIFYDQLIRVLDAKMTTSSTEEMLAAAASHGKEMLRLGYSLSHVVHSYGAMCQAITELATQRNANISSEEFNILNGCLDVAIAAAVSEFQFRSNEAAEEREIQSLGFLAHELRNALSSATVAHGMIKAGLVGTGGSTSGVLENNLIRMRNLIDRSLSEVRMRTYADLFIEKFHLAEMLDQIVITATLDAVKRNLKFETEVDSNIEIEADRQFLVSAIANFVQNAIKYSKASGTISLRAKIVEDRVLIEVRDQCGGIAPDKIKSLFEPYVQHDRDRSGLGLGLAIAKRAIHLSQGTISFRNDPGIGCAFIVDIPQILMAVPSTKNAVRGKDSVQPDFEK